jgi:hypothetical protein
MIHTLKLQYNNTVRNLLKYEFDTLLIQYDEILGWKSIGSFRW